jgi:hypothetical protein
MIKNKRKAYLSPIEAREVLDRLGIPVTVRSVSMVCLPIEETFEFAVSSNAELIVWRGWGVKLGDPLESITKLVSLGFRESDSFIDPIQSSKIDYIRYVKTGVNTVAYNLDILVNSNKIASKTEPSKLKSLCELLVNEKVSIEKLFSDNVLIESNGYFMVVDSSASDLKRETHSLDIANLVNSLSEEYGSELTISKESLTSTKKVYELTSVEITVPRLRLQLDVEENICKVTKL